MYRMSYVYVEIMFDFECKKCVAHEITYGIWIFPHLMKFGTNDRFSMYQLLQTYFPSLESAIGGICQRFQADGSHGFAWNPTGIFRTIQASLKTGYLFFFKNFELHIQNRPANQLQHIPSAVSMSPPFDPCGCWSHFDGDPTHAPQWDSSELWSASSTTCRDKSPGDAAPVMGIHYCRWLKSG